MTQKEQELSEQLFGGLERGMGVMEAIKQGLKEFRDAMFPGLTWNKISSDLGKEANHQVAAGAHEMAAALFNGNAFVMYQRQGKEDQPVQDQAQDAQNLQHDAPDAHLERGGRSM